MSRQLSSGPHFITTAPTTTTCSRCSSPLLAATVGGLDVHVDPVALNDLGELSVLLDGRATYEISSAELLTRRRPERIRAGKPATVLGAHACMPVVDAHVDHRALAQAGALVRSLLGATSVKDEDPDAPPPF